MKKKILALCLVVVLAVTAVTGATLAYFTDSEQYTNTMTIGNISINLEERTWDYENEKYVNYKDEITSQLVPVDFTNEQKLKDTKQWNNKIVKVINDSESKLPAYIRTIIAVQHIDSDNEYGYAVGYRYNDQSVKEVVEIKNVTIGGVVYDVCAFVDVNEQPVEYWGNHESMTDVFLYSNVTSEEMKDVENVKILVLAQGIQADGLTHAEAMEALGEVNAANVAAWFTGEDKAPDATINDIYKQ